MHSNGPIPGLESCVDDIGPADLSIRLVARPPWWQATAVTTFEHAERDERGVPLLCMRQYAGGRVLMRYRDDTHFWIDAQQGEVWAHWPDALTLEDTATYLLGPVMGQFLRRRGDLCLHASAVIADGRCIAFAGPAGSGKSTLAAGMARRGQRILTEDVCRLTGTGAAITVQPGYPRIRLWPDAAEVIGIPIAGLPPLTPNWDKRFLPLAGSARQFHDRPERLDAVFVLNPRREMPEPARLEELSGQARLAELAANTYGTYLLDRGERGAEFSALGALARAVPVRALTLNADGGRLAEACDWIERHAFH